MSKKSPTLFIAGATGYTGREVVRLLCQRDLRVFAHIRPDSPQLTDWQKKFAGLGATSDATPWTLAAMTATLKRLQPDIIFALLGTTRARMHKLAKAGADAKSADYVAVDTGLTLMLLQAAQLAKTKPLFVYLSAMGADGPALGGYLKARKTVEAALQKSTLPFLIARPAIITGPDRDENRPLENWGALATGTLSQILNRVGFKRAAARFRPITGVALAEALVRGALDSRFQNHILKSEDLQDLLADRSAFL